VARQIFFSGVTTTCPCTEGGASAVSVLAVSAGTWRDFNDKTFAWNDEHGDSLAYYGNANEKHPWTNDSKSLFLRRASGNELELVRADGSNARTVTTVPNDAFPSPDQKYVVVNYSSDSTPPDLVEVATGAKTSIPISFSSSAEWFDWSPDSAVFVVGGQAHQDQLKDFVVIGRDGAIKWRFHD